MIDMKALRKPFRPHEIDWRVGNTNQEKTMGMALAYMDARAVMERLDAVCGPENWQDRYPHVGDKTCCEIGLRIDDEWIWKADGAGDTNFEGDKGAFSDAFKRAAFRWGIGRYLYSLDAPWVPIQQRGRSYVITEEGLTQLNKMYREKIWRGPLGVQALKDGMRAFINALGSAQNLDEVDEIIRANKDILEQCEYDEPTWYYGQGDVPSVNERVMIKRDELNMAEVAV